MAQRAERENNPRQDAETSERAEAGRALAAHHGDRKHDGEITVSLPMPL
jgi:hypothetical protein